MITNYKTERAAYGAVQEEETIYAAENYCPLLRDHCNVDCVCFGRIKVTNTRKTAHPWKLSKEFGCKNKMFFGGS